MESRKRSWMTMACFFGYFLFGFIDNMKGVTLSGVLDEMGFSYVDGANIVLGEYAGFVLATVLTGFISDWFGRRSVMFIAGLFLLVGSLGYGNSASLPMFIVTFAMIGAGCGSMELGGSNIISQIHSRNKGRYLNLLTCFHGVGSMLVPQFVGIILSMGHGWRMAYLANAVLAAAFILAFLTTKKLPRQVNASINNHQKPVSTELFTQRALVLDFIMFCYVATEIALATWLVDFLMKDKSLSFSTASWYLSAYFASIMLGRFTGSLIVDKIGYARAVWLCALGAMLTLSFGIMGSGHTAILLPLTGLFYATIFPTTTAIVSNMAKHSHGALLGILFCCGGFGGMLGPWLTGFLNGKLGTRYGMAVNVAFCVGIAIAAKWLVLDDKRRSIAD